MRYQLPLDLPSAKIALSQLQKELRDVQIKHRALRDAELEQQAIAYALAGDTTKAKVLSDIRNRERIRHIFQRIRAIRQRKRQSNYLSSIEIPRHWPEPSDNPTLSDFTADYDAIKNDPTKWRTNDTPQEI